MNTLTAPAPVTVPAARLFSQALFGGALAATANVALFFGAKAAGVPMEGEFQPGVMGPLAVGAVVAASVVPAVPGAFTAWLLTRFTKQGARTFAILAGAFALLSLGGPLNVAQAAVSTKVVMELMHVFAAVGITGMLLRAMRS